MLEINEVQSGNNSNFDHSGNFAARMFFFKNGDIISDNSFVGTEDGSFKKSFTFYSLLILPMTYMEKREINR